MGPVMVTPTLGMHVLYRLTTENADHINRRRLDAERSMAEIQRDQRGYVAHVGSYAQEGQVYPGQVVRLFESVPQEANLQVALDGNDALWVCSVRYGTEPGQWIPL